MINSLSKRREKGLPCDAASHARRPQSSDKPTCEPQNAQVHSFHWTGRKFLASYSDTRHWRTGVLTPLGIFMRDISTSICTDVQGRGRPELVMSSVCGLHDPSHVIGCDTVGSLTCCGLFALRTPYNSSYVTHRTIICCYAVHLWVYFGSRKL